MARDELKNLLEQLNLSKEQSSRVQNLLESFEFADTPTVEMEPGQPETAETEDTFFLGESDESQMREIPLRARTKNEDEPQRLGRYIDLGVLGIGGMGEVRKVLDENLKRTLAMKIIHPRLMASRRSISRFVEEAQVGAQLQHPNIVPVHEIGRLPDGRHYFTMKQVRGGEFTPLIQSVHDASDEERWRPAPDGTTFRHLVHVFHTVCMTMAYAHSMGVAHRDLKPENILIGGFGEVLVVDWGIAKVVGRQDAGEDDAVAVETERSSGDMATRIGSVAGTPCYMSPEQAAGQTEAVGFASDIYTLGAILYHLLCGNPPYPGLSGEEILDRVSTLPPKPLVEGRSKLPDPLVEICERAMQRAIPDRYPSAEGVAADVLAWLEGAEKRDKALTEVEGARRTLEQAEQREAEATEMWKKANDLLERSGPTSEAGWEAWTEGKGAEREARQLRHRHMQQMQGALVHDPALEEAHEALAQMRLLELATATAQGDRRAAESIRHAFQHHCTHLSAPRRQDLEQRLALLVADTIAGQRSRRGALVGRLALREAIAEQMRSGTRLITLVGTAGVGKTRLALELAEDLRQGTSRAFFCDLTEAMDEIGVFRLISKSMSLRLRDAQPREHLAEALGETPTLLVLDNLEQVLAEVGPICHQWIEEIPDLRILATSRARMDISTETAVSIKTLSLLESVELFTRRGQAADTRFELQPENRALVCSLVKKLDGLPLAIELAAARLNVLSLQDVANRLDKRFSLLRSHGRDAQALEGALDWSWDMLKPWGKAVLSQSSLFHGGFNLAAAEGVIELGDWSGCPPMFDILGDLAENSLLRRDQGEDGSVRYGLLESIRAYSSDKLHTPEAVEQDLSGTAATSASQHRHAAHFSEMGATEALSALDQSDSATRWVTLFQELDNLVAGIDHGTPDTAALCCVAAMKILVMKGPVSLGVDIATKVLALPDVPRRLQMQLEIERSKCLRISGRIDEARAVVRNTSNTSLSPSTPTWNPDEASIPDPSEGAEDGILRADRLREMGNVEHVQSNADEACSFYQQSLDLYRKYGDRNGEGIVLGNLGNSYRAQDQLEKALETYQAALEIHRETRNKQSEGSVHGHLGLVYQAQGRLGEAVQSYEQALFIHGQSGNRHFESNVLVNLGSALRAQGKLEAAVDHCKRAMEIHQEIGSRRGEGVALGNLGIAYQAQGRQEAALDCFQRSVHIHREIGDKRFEGLYVGKLGEALLELGRTEEAQKALRFGADLCQDSYPVAACAFRAALALILAREGRFEEARELLSTSESSLEANKEEQGRFFCKAGQVAVLENRIGDASLYLRQARRISKTICVTDQSQLSQDISSLEAMFGGSPPDEGDGAERPLSTWSPETLPPDSSPLDDPGPESPELALLEADRVVQLGLIEYEQANYEKAEACYRTALGVYDGAENAKGQGVVLAALGVLFRDQGRLEDAHEYLHQAIGFHHRTGDRFSEAAVLASLAVVFVFQGQIDEALERYQSALDIHRSLGARAREGVVLGSMGTALQTQGQLEESIPLLREALGIHQEIGARTSEGNVLGNLGIVFQLQGQMEAAIEHYQLALAIHRETGARASEGIFLGNLGDALLHLDRVTEAREALEEAISICDDALPPAAGAFRGSLALLLAGEGAFQEAHELLEAGESLVAHHREELGKLLCKRGRVQLLDNDPDAARSSLARAQAIASELKVGEHSELAQAIAEFQDVLASAR